MTICYPQIITARLCPRDELTFSATPPNCVRVVPVYNDASYVLSQFPPPVHFFVTDNGLVYQLADIQSPPSTPLEYHAVLDSTGCILIGVELSSVTTAPLTEKQIEVLPGVLRHVLQTLGLPLASVTNTLPPQRCRPQLWQEIVQATTLCLNTPPPPPPNPPSLTCSFVISCLQPGQNINISAGGTISAGQLVPGPNNNQYTWLAPNGNPLFSFSTAASSLSVQDTNTVDLTLAGNVLSADVIVSPNAGNQIQVLPNGLYVPPSAVSITAQDTSTVDLTLVGGVLSANVLVSGSAGNQIQIFPDGLYVPPVALNVTNTPSVNLNLSGSTLSANVNISSAPGNVVTINPDGIFVPNTSNPCLTSAPAFTAFPTTNLLVSFNQNNNCLEQIAIPPERVVYGDIGGSGAPQVGDLFYLPAPANRLVGQLGPSSLTGFQNTFMMVDASSLNPINAHTVIMGVRTTYVSGTINDYSGIIRNSSIVGTLEQTLGVFNGVSISGTINHTVGAFRSANLSGTIGFSLISADGLTLNAISQSVISAESLSGNTITRSLAISQTSIYGDITGSMVNTRGVDLPFANLSVVNAAHSSSSVTQPRLSGSLYIAEQSNAIVFANPRITFSTVTSRLTLYAETDYEFSTIHADVSHFTGGDLISHSFVSARQSTIGGARRSVLIASAINNQTPHVYQSILLNDTFNTFPPRNGPSAPIIDTSMILTRTNTLPKATASVYVYGPSNFISSVESSVVVSDGVIVADPTPPNNVATVRNSLIVGVGHDISSVLNVDSLTLVGTSLAAGSGTVFGVGVGVYTSPAIQAAGGWLAFIANNGNNAAQNYFQGWASNWRFTPFNPSVSYPNDAAAISALNAAYASDPRIAVATMTVAIVNNVPAIFAWNGFTFVRITV